MRLPSQTIQFTTGTASSAFFLFINLKLILRQGAASCIVQLIVLCIVGKYLAVTVPFLTAVLFLVQKYYLRTSRRLRLIDIEVKAPLYDCFVETIAGASTIRSFKWSNAYYSKHGEILNQAQRPFYMLFCIQQWLQLVLDLIVGVLAVLVITFATSISGIISAGSTGVALVLILQFNSVLTQSIQAWTRLETSIGAVARVQKFVHETPSEPTSPYIPSSKWPERGVVRFCHVSACHR
jgi:ABC-type multidrug transport system fused ATPase/permease subunit